MTVKPTKPMAVFSLIVWVALLIVALTSMHRFTLFLGVWIVVGVGIVGLNVWAAFSRDGGLYTLRSREDR
jgi:hypothetical protein